MSNIVIEWAPVSYKINYWDCVILEKNKLTEWINRMKDFYYNPSKETYWPFEWEEAISFLKILDYEDRV